MVKKTRGSKMEKKKKTFCPAFKLFLLFLFLIVASSCSTDSSYYLLPGELANKKRLAVKGDGNAAVRVADYYSYVKNDMRNWEFWTLIGAENDYGRAMDDLMFFMPPGEKETRTRDAFWLYRFGTMFNKDVGNSLKYYDCTMETAKPPSDSLYPLVSPLSETDIPKYKDGALLGIGQAAFVLGNHYTKNGTDSETAGYWYRIGAQNRNAECMQIYGDILLGKKDNLDRERGRFWLAKASN